MPRLLSAKTFRLAPWLAAVCVLVALAAALQAAVTPLANDLGSLGGPGGSANDVNANGMVVGSSDVAASGPYHAFAWTEANGMLDLGTLGGTHSVAFEVSDNGVVVGNSARAGDPPNTHRWPFVWTAATGMMELTLGGDHAQVWEFNKKNGILIGEAAPSGTWPVRRFAWTPTAGMVDLTALGLSSPAGISDNGVVVGRGPSIDGYPVRTWTEAGGVVTLGNLGAPGSAIPSDINNHGVIVGNLFRPGDPNVYPFVWSASDGFTQLSGGLPGMAYAVNDAGLVMGQLLADSGWGWRAFVWSQTMGLVDLGTFGGDSSYPMVLNEAGLVAGESTTPGNASAHGFIWTLETGVIDVNLGGYSRAVAANDAGLVVGVGRTPQGFFHAFAWTAADGVVDLGTLGGSSSIARNVNRLGQIVGDSTPADSGQWHPTLWTLSRDTMPPAMACGVSPSIIWPPNGRLEQVHATVSVTDTGSGPAGFTLLSVTSNEGSASDIVGFQVGTADVDGMLRATRAGGGDGRRYTLTYEGRDVAGNTVTCSIDVLVPHDLGRRP